MDNSDETTHKKESKEKKKKNADEENGKNYLVVAAKYFSGIKWCIGRITDCARASHTYFIYSACIIYTKT